MSAGTFLPVNLSDCVLWLDGSDHLGKYYNYTVDGTAVKKWFDKSGQNNHATPTSVSSVTISSAQNGRSFIQINKGLNLTNSIVFPTGSPGQTLFILANVSAGANSGIPFGLGTEILGWSGDSNAYINFGFNDRRATGVNFLGFNIYSAVANRTSKTVLFKNGASVYSDAYTTNAARGFSVGVGQYGFTGSVYEIIAYNRTLSVEEQQKVEGYLAYKWGAQGSLAATHPYKTTFPAREGSLKLTVPIPNMIGFIGSTLIVDPIEFAGQSTSYSASLLKNGNIVKTSANSYTVSLTNLTTVDAGTYTYSLSDGTNTVTSSTFTIEIADTPISVVRNLSSNITFSTSSISSATYSWLLNGSAIASQTARTYTISSIAAASYGRYNVVIRKDNVNWTSPDFTLTQIDTPINTQIVIPKIPGYFIEYPTTLTSSYVLPTKPYQAIEILDNGAVLFRDSASAYNLLLTESSYINKTSADGHASIYLFPRPRTSTDAPTIASPAYLTYAWDKIVNDANGTYFAVLCKGTVASTANRQFIQIYKFTGTELVYVQQILNTASPTSETLGTMSSIAMSYDGQILIWAWGSSIYVYKKNAGQDTWGSSGSATITPNFTTNFTATTSIHRVTTNHNGSIICANLGTTECDIFTSSNLTSWTKNTTLKTSLNTQIQRNVSTSQNVSTLKNADMFTSSDSSYIHFFSTINTYTITFKYDPSTSTAIFLHSNNSGTTPSFSKSNYFIVNNTEAVVKKIPAFYIRTTTTSGTTAGEIAINEGNTSTRYFFDYRTQYQLATSPIMLLSADGRRLLVQQTGTDKSFFIADVSFSMTPYIPTIANTDTITIGNQNEFTTTGSFFYIDNIINTILKQTGYGVNGILIRFGDNRSNINSTLTKVGDWRLTANNTTTTVNMSSVTSTQYSINSKPWYIYRNQNPGSTTTVNSGQYVQFNCLSTQIFNSELFDTSNFYIEYKLWNGLGNPNSVTLNGNIIIIDNENDPNLPFSPQTGKLNIYINNLPDLPERIGRISTPLATPVSGTSPTKYKIVYNKKKYSINPPILTLQEMIRQFRPTMSKDIPITSSTPYDNSYYKGGFAMRIGNADPRMTLSYDKKDANGNTTRSNWIVLASTSGAGTYYFKQDYNYSFIMYGNTSSGAPYISLWSGQRGTGGDNIIDYSENSNAAGTLGGNGLQSGDAEPAVSGTAKVVRSFSGDLAYDYIDVVVADNITPILKTTGPYTIKNSQAAEEEVLDSFNSETDIKTFSIPDLFYGIPNSNGIRDPTTTTIRAGTSNTSDVDLYDPDISGDQQILGLSIRLSAALSTTEGKWQYTLNGNTTNPTWTDMYRDSTDLNKYLRLWNYNKTDNKVRIRFRPTSREETGYVSLPFQVYDGSDFIPYNNNGASYLGQTLPNIEDNTYKIADSWFRTTSTTLSTVQTSSVSATIGTLRLKIKHINSAPSIGANKIITSTPYRFNSSSDILANSTGSSQFSIKNKSNNILIVNLSDIVNDIGFTDADLNSRSGIVVSNLDMSSVATVQVEYNTKEVVTIAGDNSIDLTNAFHLPAGPRANAPYTRTISSTNANLTHWYDFSDLSTISLSGEKISAINNKVTNTDSRRLIQTNDSFKPTIARTTINGYSCARFNRSNSTFLTMAQTPTADDNMGSIIASTNSFTILLVERRSFGPASGDVPLFGSSDSAHYASTQNTVLTLTYRNQTNIVFGPYLNETTTTNTDANNELTYNDGREPVRIWRFVFDKTNKNYDVYLNGKRIGTRNHVSVPIMATQYRSRNPVIGRANNSYYDGDMCEMMVFNSEAVSNIRTIENYLMYKWQSASLLIQPVENKTLDISMNFYAWDQANRAELLSAYGPITTRGGTSFYSENGARLVVKILKSNTCPVLSMDPLGNASAIVAQSTANQLVFDLGKFEMTNTYYEVTTESLFVNTIKTKYNDIDADNERGLAITSVDSTIGTWYAVKPDGTTVNLTSTSQSNAYLMRSSPDNKLRVVLRSSDISLNNYYHTSAKPGRPGSSFFTAIGWDNTTRSGYSYSEYSFANVVETGRTNESTFSDPTKTFRFNVSTRPYITSRVDRDLFVFNSDDSKTSLRVNSFQSSFVMSQASSSTSTKRIDIAGFTNIGSDVLLQYRTASNQPWQALALPLTSPLNGNYDIRINPAESPSLAAINAKTFIMNLTLYDTESTTYSANYGYFNISVIEANLIPSISVNNAASLRARIDNLSGNNIKYETIFNDITSNYPLLNFGTLTSSLGPIVWTDNNVNSILKIKGFAMQIMNNINGTFYYQDTADSTIFYPIGFTDSTSRILLNYKNNIRFIPQTGTRGSAIIRLYAWDGVSGANTSTVLLNSDGTYNAGAFSSSYITVEFPVIPRNTAPKLLQEGKIYDLTIPQTDNNDDVSGNLISDFVDNVLGFDYEEADAQNLKGIALIAYNTHNLGLWQYSTNNGLTWSNVSSTISNNSALHLQPSARIRFQFTITTEFRQSYSASLPTLTFRAWDGTNDLANGSTAPISQTGEFEAYSSNTSILRAPLTHVNHAPVLLNPNILLTGSVSTIDVFNIGLENIVNQLGASYIDADLSDNKGLILIDISSANTRDSTKILGVWTYTNTILSNIQQRIDDASPITTLMTSSNTSLRFTPETLSKGKTTLTFALYDGQARSTDTFKYELTITDVNYAPTFDIDAANAIQPYDISYNTIRTITIQSILNEIIPSDINENTTYGLAFNIQRLAQIGKFEYTLNPNASSPVYTEIINSTFGINNTALHLPSTAAIRYTPVANEDVTYSINCTLWDRTNSGSIIQSNGYASAVSDVESDRGGYTPYSLNTFRLVFNNKLVNYAPTLNNPTPIVIDVSSIACIDLFNQLTYTDENANDSRGLVFIAKDIYGGHFEYSIDNASTWTSFPTISQTSGWHTTIDTNEYIRYVKDINVDDTATLTVIAWDRTNTTSSDTWPAIASVPTIRGGNTPYSASTAIYQFSQTHINTRPVLANSVTSTIGSVDGTAVNTPWVQINTLLQDISDVDLVLRKRANVAQVANPRRGIVITDVDPLKGTWQWSLSNTSSVVNNVRNPSETGALVLDSSTYIRFIPSQNRTQTATLTYRAWDGTSSSNGNSINIVADDSPSASFSTVSGTITASVIHVNEAPILYTPSSNIVLYTAYGDSIDTASNTGISIKGIIDRLDASGLYVDNDISNNIDPSENRGIAITQANEGTSNGFIEYTINGGASWTLIPSTISTTNALLLSYSVNNGIRLRPNINASGLNKKITFFGWDLSDGAANGSFKNISNILGGSQAYSLTNLSAFINTAYTNRRPVLGKTSITLKDVNGNNTSNYGIPVVDLVSSAYLGITDRDTRDLKGIAIIGQMNDVNLSGVFEYKMTTSSSWTSFTLSAGNALFLNVPANAIPTNTTSFVRNTTTALNADPYSTVIGPLIRFRPTQNPVTDTNATLTVYAWDGTEGSTGIRSYGSLTTSLSTNTASVVFPVVSVNASPTINAKLDSTKVRTFRTDNKLTPRGGQIVGITVSQILNDMGYTDVGGSLRGMAIIDTFMSFGAVGNWSYKIGNNPWRTFPRISSRSINPLTRQVFFLAETTNGIANRIRFDSVANFSGLPQIAFYGWDQTDPLPTSYNGTLRSISTTGLYGSEKPLSAAAGIYNVRINAIPNK